MSERSFGPDRDWLLQFSPAPQRPALDALFSIEAEIEASLRPGLEHEVAHARLGWWHEELDRLSKGEARHPATRQLAAYMHAQQRSSPDLRGLIEHARISLAAVAFLTRAELDEYLAHWATGIFRTVALCAPELPAAPDRAAQAERLAAAAGPALRELQLLEEFSAQARSGRIHVPLGDPPADHSPWLARPLGPQQRAALLSRQSELLSVLVNAAAATSPDVRPVLRAPLLWMTLIADRSRRAPGQFGDRGPRLPTRRDAWRRTMLMWRAALALARGNLPAPIAPRAIAPRAIAH